MAKNKRTLFDWGRTKPDIGSAARDSETSAKRGETIPDDSRRTAFEETKTELDGEAEHISMLDAALSDAAAREGTPLSNDEIKKGDTLLETYTVEINAIESGGMGRVWRVHHNGWNVELAMKRPRPESFETEKQKESFIRECEAWIDLGLHPNVVSCYYVREIGGTPAIFSEWMDGGSLEDAISTGALYKGPEKEQQKRLLDVAIQFARGLRYAHEAGLIHQDVKPDNVLLTKEGDAKVADFGLARARAMLTALEGRPTGIEGGADRFGTIMTPYGGCTIAYCSMEQMDKKPLTRRTDIYSWAVSVMEMYVGARPWAEDRYGSGVVAGLKCGYYFDRARVKMPDALRELLAWCMKAKPEDRPRDFGEIEAALLGIYNSETGVEYPRTAPKAAADTSDSLNNRALSMLDLGKPAEAEKCWSRAAETNPDDSDVIYNRAVYLYHAGKLSFDGAVSAVRINFENHFGDPKSSVYLARLWWERGNDYNARGYLGQAGDGAPGGKALLESVERGERYSCEYTLCQIRDYRELSRTLAKYAAREAEIEALLDGGKIQEACKLMLTGTVSQEYREFSFTEAGFRLNERLSRVGYPMQVLASWRMHDCGRYALSVSFSPDGKTMLAGDKLYSVTDGRCLREFGEATEKDKATDEVDASTLEFNRFLASIGGRRIDTYIPPKTVCSEMDWSGRYFLRAKKDERDFEMIDVASGGSVMEFCGHIAGVNSVAFSPDGKLAISGGDDETIRIWRTEDGELARTIQMKGAVKKARLSYEGHAIAMTEDCVAIYDLSDGRLKYEFKLAAKDFAVNSQFSMIAFALGSEGLCSCELVGGRDEPKELRHHYDKELASRGLKTQDANCVCFMPNDQFVLVGSEDMAYFWFMEENKILSPITCRAVVTGIATDSSGKRLAVMTTEGAQIWRNYLVYQYSGEGGWSAGRLGPYGSTFVDRYPNFTEKDFDEHFMKELGDRGFGFIRREEALRAVNGIRRENAEARPQPAGKPVKVKPLSGAVKGLKVFEGLAFGYEGTESDLVLPEGVTKIGRRTFEGNRFIRSVVFPEGLSVIQEGAFRGCTALERVALPSTLKVLEKEAFARCPRLKMPKLPEGLEYCPDSFDETTFNNK